MHDTRGKKTEPRSFLCALKAVVTFCIYLVSQKYFPNRRCEIGWLYKSICFPSVVLKIILI